MKQQIRIGKFIRIGLLALLFVQFITLSSQFAVNAAPWTPSPKPSNFSPGWLPICNSDTQLDCLESIGANIGGVVVKGAPTGRIESNSFNNSVIPEWKIPGLVNEDGKDLVQTQLRTRELPGGQIGISLEMYVSSQDGFRPKWESARNDCTYRNTQGECFRFGNPQKGVSYIATIRSSWIVPNIVSGSLDNADATVEKLSVSGASRVTVSGTPMTYQLRDNAIAGQKDEAGLGLLQWFRFDITDGRFLPRPWECLDAEPPLVFGNGVGGGSAPTFTNGQLDFQVSSPHFEPDATTKFIGYYNATIPLATAECMWKSDISKASQLAVQIFESTTGDVQTANTTMAINNGKVVIRSSGFTYSTKTVRVAPTQSTVKAPSKPTSVKATAGKGTIKVSFKRTTGVTYSVLAKSGSIQKKLGCKSSPTIVTCSASRLKRGSWKVTITPQKGTVKGNSANLAIRVK